MGKLVTITQLGSEIQHLLQTPSSLCILNNHLDMAVENNWSAFVEGPVEIKFPWQMVCLVQDPVSSGNTFSRKCMHICH